MTIDLDPRVASGGELKPVDSSAGTDGESTFTVSSNTTNNDFQDFLSITGSGVLQYWWITRALNSTATSEVKVLADGANVFNTTISSGWPSVCYPFFRAPIFGSGMRFTTPLYFAESLTLQVKVAGRTSGSIVGRYNYYLLES